MSVSSGFDGDPPKYLLEAFYPVMSIAVVVLSLATDQVLHVLDVYPPWGQPMHATDLVLLALPYRLVYGVLGSYIAARFEAGWQRAYWGVNYPRLLEVKNRYDPDGLFFVHHGVGSERWSADGFTRLV